jgi:recombination protein RecT
MANAATTQNQGPADLVTQAGDSSVKSFLRSRMGTISQALEGTTLTPQRLLSVTMTEVRKNPVLRECSQDSLFGSLVQAAQLGLEPGSALGHCYLVPYFNNTSKRRECQFQIGYRGMIALARRSGEILSISSHCVYEKDEFDLVYGMDESLAHKPYLTGDPGALLGAYAVASMANGGKQWSFLPRHKIDAVRSGSPGSNKGPWKTHYDEMAQKTAMRSLFKWLPVSVEAQTACALDSMADAGESQGNEAVIGEGDGGLVVDEEGAIVDGSVKSAADLNTLL